MTTVTDLMPARTCIVTDPYEIDRLRWFQTGRYVDSGLLDERPACLPQDEAVAKSTYFGVYNDNDVVATARIIRDVDGLPIRHYHDFYPEVEARLNAYAGSVAEISRLAAIEQRPRFRNLALLSREFLRFGLNNPHAELLVASVGWPLARILNRFLGVPLEVIGPAIEQYGEFEEVTVPVLIDTVQCVKAFREQASGLADFFLEDLVIDLTLDEPALALVAS